MKTEDISYHKEITQKIWVLVSNQLFSGFLILIVALRLKSTSTLNGKRVGKWRWFSYEMLEISYIFVRSIVPLNWLVTGWTLLNLNNSPICFGGGTGIVRRGKNIVLNGLISFESIAFGVAEVNRDNPHSG